MPLLNVALVPAPDQVVVRVTGEADLSTVPLLADALEQAAGLGTARVVVDVARTRFWDCSGLHALADFTADLDRAGRQCRIVGATPATRRLVVLADYATSLVLDGPLYLPAVVPEPAPAPQPDPRAGTPVPPPAARIASTRARPPVSGHRAPFRRRDAEAPAGGRQGTALTLRRWG